MTDSRLLKDLGGSFTVGGAEVTSEEMLVDDLVKEKVKGGELQILGINHPYKFSHVICISTYKHTVVAVFGPGM